MRFNRYHADKTRVYGYVYFQPDDAEWIFSLQGDAAASLSGDNIADANSGKSKLRFATAPFI